MNDLFQLENSPVSGDSKAASLPPHSIAPRLQFVRTPCECGATGGWRNVEHYDVVRCSCGKYYWILQPKRNGAFVAKLYPGIPGLRV